MRPTMSDYTDPHKYWDERLSSHFDLTGVGHRSLGPYYNQYMYRVRLRTLEWALKASGYQFAGKRVLEVGCGTGFYTGLCQRQGVASYTGVDIAPVSVRNLSQRFPHFTFLRADIADQ